MTSVEIVLIKYSCFGRSRF